MKRAKWKADTPAYLPRIAIRKRFRDWADPNQLYAATAEIGDDAIGVGDAGEYTGG